MKLLFKRKMASASKLLPPELAELECGQLIHPWSKNCFEAFLNVYLYSCFGSSGYFALLYFFQYLARAVKKKNQSEIKEIFKTYIGSSFFFASIVASCYMAFSCFIRYLLGRYYYYTVVFLPATFAGLAISNETPRNQDFFSTAFANMALESWISKIRGSGTIKWTENGQILVFMVLTCILSHLYKDAKNQNKLFWFFVPPKIAANQENSTACFHEDSCFRTVSNNFVTYFTTGFLLKLLKLVFAKFKEPKQIFLSLFKPRTYSFAAFLGFYALVYQSTRCVFYRKWRKYTYMHDLLSGFLSGVTYKFEPNISIFNSAVITIFQILIDIAQRKKILPDLPYSVLMFAISSGVLFHTRFFQPKHCPALMQYIMSSVTNKKADIISQNYHKLLKQL